MSKSIGDFDIWTRFADSAQNKIQHSKKYVIFGVTLLAKLTWKFGGALFEKIKNNVLKNVIVLFFECASRVSSLYKKCLRVPMRRLGFDKKCQISVWQCGVQMSESASQNKVSIRCRIAWCVGRYVIFVCVFFRPPQATFVPF